MALPMMTGGSGKAATNPMQKLAQRMDHDRSLQQDRFSAGRPQDQFRQAGPSRGRDQDAARFFGGAARHQAPSPNAFDMSMVHGALPQHPAIAPSMMAPPTAAAALGPSWATDFLAQQPQQQGSRQKGSSRSKGKGVATIQTQMPGMVTGNAAWQQFPMNYNAGPVFQPNVQAPASPIVKTQVDDRAWSEQFDRQVAAADQRASNETQQNAGARTVNQDSDELARTAGLLIESIKAETNPKFANSQFLGLMRNLRDREVVVEGNELVEGTPEQKAAALAAPPTVTAPVSRSRLNVEHDSRRAHRSVERSFERRLQQQDEGMDLDEDPNEAYFRQENAEFKHYWDAHHAEPVPTREELHIQQEQYNAQKNEWNHLQETWDMFESTSGEIKELDNYQFQDNNPYLLGDRSKTRHHTTHLNQAFYESVLELEAAVQRDPLDAGAWYELGVKQQENEREQKAIMALRRALELDPSHLPTYIALAVSYTNDNNRPGTYNVIREWVDRNEIYAEAVKQYRDANPEVDGKGYVDRFNDLIQCLISMARSDSSGGLDADIQIAIAVLLNTNEDYNRAQDCFRAALSVRPDDWLLYNRVGATMANSGKSEEAIEYYYKALQLNPGYIRARYNLGISCINLRRYDEAAQNILDALVLQDSDGVKDEGGLNDKRGVTSSALWDSLKTASQHMRRPDLANLCDFHDLEGYRTAFSRST